MKEKLSLLKDLIKVANADGQFREEEQQFIFAIAEQMGVTPKDYTRLFKENIEYKSPVLEVDRILQFQRIILVMNVDQNVSLKEIKEVQNLGLKMGLHPDAINLVLTEMNDYRNNILPPARLIEIFKTHHN
jgi:uncharacterized tellurite resistance protein B-like protein